MRNVRPSNERAQIDADILTAVCTLTTWRNWTARAKTRTKWKSRLPSKSEREYDEREAMIMRNVRQIVDYAAELDMTDYCLESANCGAIPPRAHLGLTLDRLQRR